MRALRVCFMLAILVVTIFAMAGVYYVMWLNRPDYFRVQSGVNSLPIDLASIAQEYSAFSNAKPLPNLVDPNSSDKAAQRIEEIYGQFHDASVRLAAMRRQYDQAQQRVQAGYKSFEASQEAQAQAYVAQRTATFDLQLKQLHLQMQTLLTSAGVRSESDLPSGYYAIRHADLNIQAANINLERSKALASAWSYVTEHWTAFQQLPAQKSYLKLLAESDALLAKIDDEGSKTGALHGALYDALADYRQASIRRLDYWDFLYFSVGASTTATFGDIAPNSTNVRLLVCAQVLGSLFFIGLLVNAMANRRSESAAAD